MWDKERISRQIKQTRECQKSFPIRILVELQMKRHEMSSGSIVFSIKKFFVDPDDFGQSVENLFHLSFLIRDGKCALVTNEDEEPEIYSTDPPTDEDKMEGNIAKHQAIIDFDMNAWRRAIEVFDITEPVVPHRPQTVSQGDKWYG
ncbi:Non-structural maintenance of chromosomes element 4 [Abortiporus biennis]